MVQVKRGALAAQGKVAIGGHIVTSTITADIVEDPGPGEGKIARLVIKAPEVIPAID